MIRREARGNLYLIDKQGGEFTEADETAAAVLADVAPRYWCRSVCHRSGAGPHGFDTPSRPPGLEGRHASARVPARLHPLDQIGGRWHVPGGADPAASARRPPAPPNSPCSYDWGLITPWSSAYLTSS